MYNFQLMLNKLVKFIKIDIGKKLGSEISYRQSAFTLSLGFLE